jgi:hypothetical protein
MSSANASFYDPQTRFRRDALGEGVKEVMVGALKAFRLLVFSSLMTRRIC